MITISQKESAEFHVQGFGHMAVYPDQHFLSNDHVEIRLRKSVKPSFIFQ